MCVCMCVCMYIYICIYSVYVCLYVCMYIYICTYICWWWGILGGALAQDGTAEKSIWRDTASETETVLQDGNNLQCMYCVCFAHAIGFRLV